MPSTPSLGAALGLNAPELELNDTTEAPDPQPPPSLGAALFHQPREIEPERQLGEEFTAGVSQGTDSIQMALHGVTRMLGRELGIETLERIGEEGIARNQQQMEEGAPPTIGSISEIEDAGDFFKWAAAGIGQNLPSLALTAAGGGLGGVLVKKGAELALKRTLANRISQDLMKRGLTAKAAQAAGRRAMNGEVGKKVLVDSIVRPGVFGREVTARAFGRGALSGAVSAGALPITGSTDIELQEAGVSGGKSALTSILTGAAGGALEALPALRLLDKLFPGVDRGVSKAFVKDVASSAGMQTALEGSTEAAQEMIQIAALAFHDPTFDPFSDDSLLRVIDAFAIGALVGGVTGGAATAIGRGTTEGIPAVQRAAQRILSRPKLPEVPEFDVAEGITDPDFEPADNTFFEEVQDRVRKTMSGILNPIVNNVRNIGQNAIDQTRDAFDGKIDSQLGRLAKSLAAGHRDFVNDSSELINRVTTFANESARSIYERAESLSDPVARQRFIDEQMERVKSEVERVAQVLRRRSQQQEQNTARTIDDINFDDDLEIQDTIDPDIPAANPTQFVFGKNNTGGRQSELDLFRPDEGEVQGFTTRKAARNLLGRLRGRFPSATNATFAINEQADGTFVVELNDPASAELLVEDDRISRGLESARLSARRHRNNDRKFKLQSGTVIDVPTLIFAARDLGDVTTYNDGVLTAASRLLERGQITSEQAQQFINRFSRKNDVRLPARSTDVDRDFNALPPRTKQEINQRVNEALNDENLRGDERTERRQELLAEELDEIDLDPALQRDLGREEQGDEAQFVEEGQGRDLETEDDQARASRSRRPFSNKRESQARVNEFENNQTKGSVYVPGADKKTSSAITSVVNFIQNKLGIKTTVRVVNKQGAKNMIDRGHAHASIAARMEGAGAGRLVRETINGIEYAYVLLDTNQSPAVQATVLLHELGHQVYRENYGQLSAAGKAALRSAFVKANKNQTTSRVRGRDKFIPDEAEFNEWMADQLVAWANSEPQPGNPVQEFIAKVGAKLRELFSFLQKNPRFADLNVTYGEFISDVARRARGIDTDRFFHREAQPEGFRLPELSIDDITDTIPDAVPASTINSTMQKFASQYPTIVKRAALIRNWIVNAYSVAAAPANSVIMDIGKRVPAARKLVQIFGREAHGQAKRSQNYHQRLNLMKGQFSAEYRHIAEGLTDSEKTQLLDALREADGNPDATINPDIKGAKELRDLFDKMHKYLEEDAGLPIGKIPNYFPRMFSRDKLIAGREEIIDHLMGRHNFPRGKAEGFYNSLISQEAEVSAALRELDSDPLSAQAPGFRNMRSRQARNEFFDAYLEDNVDSIVANYINAAVKRGEFNRFMGHKSKTKRGWKPRGAYDALLKNAEAEGATEQDLKRIKQFVDANLGMLGRDFDRALPGARTAMAAWMAYQNMRVLLFTVFASLPDVVGPAIRSGDMRAAFGTVIKGIREIASSDSELAETARAYGIISDQMTDHIFTEYVDNHYMPPQLRKWNDAFFRYTGLQSYTNFTRKMALAVGKDYIKNQARMAREGPTEKSRLKAEAALRELGLDADQVNEWVADGSPTWDGGGSENKTNQLVAEGLVQFVDESIMRPNASQRPILASHPGAMLVFHLKGYMYAMYEVVVRRMAHNFNQAETSAQALAAVAPALLMMALTAVGLELRELVQYAFSGREPPTDRMDGWDYTWTLVERAGLLGHGQLAFDFTGADKVGMTGVAALGGPSLGQFAEILSRPPSQTVPKALPVIGQIPWARDGLREVTPL